MPTHTPVLIADLSGVLDTRSDGREWIVVRSKPRCEKKLAQYSSSCGIDYYLPQVTSSRVYQRRKVMTTQPIFTGYLFCVVDEQGKLLLAQSGMTCGFIKVEHQQSFVDELRNVYLGTRGVVALTQKEWIGRGYEVEIVNGPLLGMRGVVMSKDNLSEIQVQINILRQHLTIKVNPMDVKVIG